MVAKAGLCCHINSHTLDQEHHDSTQSEIDYFSRKSCSMTQGTVNLKAYLRIHVRVRQRAWESARKKRRVLVASGRGRGSGSGGGTSAASGTGSGTGASAGAMVG